MKCDESQGAFLYEFVSCKIWLGMRPKCIYAIAADKFRYCPVRTFFICAKQLGMHGWNIPLYIRRTHVIDGIILQSNKINYLNISVLPIQAYGVQVSTNHWQIYHWHKSNPKIIAFRTITLKVTFCNKVFIVYLLILKVLNTEMFNVQIKQRQTAAAVL